SAEPPPEPERRMAETGPDADFTTAPLGMAEPNYRPFATGGAWSGEMPAMLRPEAQPPAGPLPASVGSQGVGSWSVGASENRFGGRTKKTFWLVADAELIVYGATEPDAKVTLRGERVDLQPDGTFSFRFYLPDGLHPIPIRAINADGDDERQITITVARSTEGDGKTNLRELAGRPRTT
ncbi:MAG: hypothetical protein KGR26_17025, partial [Cyanobacteria bacterium REEB65]|nr:hypothetical protein [Cyanobacteria bacterium REEB65]